MRNAIDFLKPDGSAPLPGDLDRHGNDNDSPIEDSDKAEASRLSIARVLSTSATQQQADVLDTAREFVRPGGTLIYVTCSVLPQENEAQIADFLDRASDFTLTSMADAWVDVAGSSAPMPWSAEGLMMTMTPAATGTDGFFVAALKRTG